MSENLTNKDTLTGKKSTIFLKFYMKLYESLHKEKKTQRNHEMGIFMVGLL